MLPSPADYCTAYTWPKKAGIFQTGGGDSRWGSLAFPGPWEGIFFAHRFQGALTYSLVSSMPPGMQ